MAIAECRPTESQTWWRRWRSWRLLAGLAIMLAAIVQSARNLEDPNLVAAVWLLTAVMTVAWFILFGLSTLVGVWLLGSAACVLMLLVPGTGAVIGMAAAIVTAGLRLPLRTGASLRMT